VRSLAQRSSAASKEIKELIHDSVERVQAGAGHVREAGAKMREITQEIRRVTDIMSEITAASQEQSKASARSTRPSRRWTKFTQQNAALVEQAAAAGSLESQANDLKASVSMFRLDVSHDAGARGRVAQTHTAAPARARAPAKAAVKRSAPEPVRWRKRPRLANGTVFRGLSVPAVTDGRAVRACWHRRVSPTLVQR